MTKASWFLILIAAACALAEEPGFRPLFDGKTLHGWEGDPRCWSVKDGAIAGSTDGVTLTDNTFLVTKKKYSNFVLRAEVKLRNHNSGIQFRSEVLPNSNFVVRGLQADMAETNYWGNIYDEKGKRGTIVDGWTGKAQTVVKPHEWNNYEVKCDGDLIQLRVNGMLTAELHDTSATTGIIGLQMHKGPGMEVQFRNIRIKELK